jgi:hypothetical protein
MTRYEALSAAIAMVEGAAAVFKHEEYNQHVLETKEILQDIAKDVRYGGEWRGAEDKLTYALDRCVKMECNLCKMHNTPQCKMQLKKEAAMAIRQQRKTILELKAELDAMRGDADDSDLERPEPAEWQKEIMHEMEGHADVLPF